MPDISLTIINVIKENVPALRERQHIGLDDSLMELGMNSMKAVEVMFGLEDEFDIVIDETLVEDDSFETVRRIEDLIGRARNGLDK